MARVPNQTTSCPVAIYNISFICGPSSLHSLCGPHITSSNIKYTYNVANNVRNGVCRFCAQPHHNKTWLSILSEILLICEGYIELEALQAKQPLPPVPSCLATLVGFVGAIISLMFFCLRNTFIWVREGKALSFSLSMYCFYEVSGRNFSTFQLFNGQEKFNSQFKHLTNTFLIGIKYKKICILFITNVVIWSNQILASNQITGFI